MESIAGNKLNIQNFCFFLLYCAFVGRLQGSVYERESWHFVTPSESIATNVLEDGVSFAVCKTEKDVEFRLTDRAGNESIRGRIRRFGSYAE